MCGIAGIYRFRSAREVRAAEVEAMIEVLRHRGPDGSGTFVDGNIGLGHRRLSIIDPDPRSNQPMASDTGRAVITYNGEIYNYVELRRALEATTDAVFQTTSDTEVLANLWARSGEGCLDELNGMFAFAAFDPQSRDLWLVRDRFGIKPLFYHLDSEGIVFASEVKAILALLGRPAKVDQRALDSYMSMGFVPGEDSMFAGIKRLPPGHVLRVRDGELSIRRWWDVEYGAETERSEESLVEEVRALVDDAVRLRLRSDVPLGVFLSGGIDSSAVVGTMSRLGHSDVSTFSLAWDFGTDYNETSFARQIARQHATHHSEEIISPGEFWDAVDDYVTAMDEPVTEAAAIALRHIAKRASQDVTVILSGEGADEVFGGYEFYNHHDWIRRYRNVPESLRRQVTNKALAAVGGTADKYARLAGSELEDFYYGVAFFDSETKRSIYSPRLADIAAEFPVEERMRPFFAKVGGFDDYTRMQYVDYSTWLSDDLLVKADRMTMDVSMELRVPFLDHRLAELLASVPSDYRNRKGRTKYLFKKAMADRVPSQIVRRPKQGFPTPLSALFRSHLRDEVADLLDSEQFHARGLFEPARVRELIARHSDGTGEYSRVLWQLVVLEKWHRIYID